MCVTPGKRVKRAHITFRASDGGFVTGFTRFPWVLDNGLVPSEPTSEPTPAEAPVDAASAPLPTLRSAGLYPRVTSYRSRRSTLTDRQRRAWDAMWPVIGADVADEVVDLTSWFGRDAPVVLEIGSGTGTATVEMAATEPEVNLVAVEVYRPGIAALLRQVQERELTNIRVLRGDAVDVLEHMLTPGSLAAVRVFFPDPWPKARHHKRRLLQASTFALIASRLRPGGVLHVATDHAQYAAAIDETGNAEPALQRVDPATSTFPVSIERPVTKFEHKGLEAHRTIADMYWIRKAQ